MDLSCSSQIRRFEVCTFQYLATKVWIRQLIRLDVVEALDDEVPTVTRRMQRYISGISQLLTSRLPSEDAAPIEVGQ